VVAEVLMPQLVPPVIIAEGRDVRVFESVAEASAALEPIDVEAGVFRGFDSRGWPLAFSTAEVNRRVLLGTLRLRSRATVITADEEAGPQANLLRELLLEFLKALGKVPECAAELPLGELVAVAREVSPG
jgi:hypothetical protein